MTKYYTEDHEWIAVTGNVATLGITDYAQAQLGDDQLQEVGSPQQGLQQGHLQVGPQHGQRQTRQTSARTDVHHR